MRTVLRLLMTALLACGSVLVPAPAQAAGGPQVLIVSDGTGNPEAVEYAIERLEMEARRWNVTLVEGNASDLDDLGSIDVVLLLNPGEDFLDPGQEESLRQFVEGGGGLVATGSGLASERDWDWYQEVLGATPLTPPTEPDVKETVDFNDGSPITDGLDGDVELTDAWYYFDPEPAEDASTVVAQLDAGDPVAWNSNEYAAFFAVPGSSADTWGERDYLQLVRQGIWWAAGEDGPLVQNTASAAPSWPYTWTFVLLVIAVAGGGSYAVWRLDQSERAKATAVR